MSTLTRNDHARKMESTYIPLVLTQRLVTRADNYTTTYSFSFFSLHFCDRFYRISSIKLVHHFSKRHSDSAGKPDIYRPNETSPAFYLVSFFFTCQYAFMCFDTRTPLDTLRYPLLAEVYILFARLKRVFHT